MALTNQLDGLLRGAETDPAGRFATERPAAHRQRDHRTRRASKTSIVTSSHFLICPAKFRGHDKNGGTSGRGRAGCGSGGVRISPKPASKE
jgi:hypothetical protein